MKQRQKTINSNGLFCIMLIGIMIMSFLAFPNQIRAEQLDAASVLKPYADELALFNQKYGTDYRFQLVEEVENEDEELAKFFGSMSLEEFRTYLLNAYRNDIASQTTSPTYSYSYTSNTISQSTSSASPRTSYSVKQCFYYGSGSNNLYIRATVYSSPVSTEHHRYVEITARGYGEDVGVYPQYIPKKYSHSISSDAYYVDVIYECDYYVAENLVYVNMGRNIPVCFEAGGGDIFAEVEV